MEAEAFLKDRADKGTLRRRNDASGRGMGRIYFGAEEYIDMSSNDYLGLSTHPCLIDAGKEALDRFGAGACASRLLSGGLEMHRRLEEDVARFKGKESALVFNSGYQANVGILSAICGKDDAIFSDRLAHASILDGITLSRAKLFRFQHNDSGHLADLLKQERSKFKTAMIVTESVFSMDGDKSSLEELVELKEEYGCQIMVDEAHATGIYGDNGAGLVEEKGLTEKVDLVMGTFSKALGSFGAYLAAYKATIEYLVNTCRSFIYSTALPPAVIACNIEGLKIVAREPWRRTTLLANSKAFRDGLKESGLCTVSDSQIVPVTVGDSHKALKAAKALQEKGYWVLPIRPPTVPEGGSRIRFSLTVNHGEDLLKKLMSDIRDAGI